MKARSILLVAAALIAAQGVTAARAEPPAPGDINLNFRVYAGGFAVLSLETKAAVAPADYTMTSRARTEGLLDVLLGFQLASKAEGRVEAAGVRPLAYRSDSDGRFGRRTIRMVWDERGVPTASTEPPADADDRDPVTPAQAQGAVDPLTAAIARAVLRNGEPCGGRDQLFDGRRRYDLSYVPAGRAELAASRWSAYAGPAIVCKVRMHRIAGYVRAAEDDNRRLDERETTLWLAPIEGGLHLPVKLQADTLWGAVIAHIVRAELGGRVRLALAAPER